jgi:hypothetical protein
MQLDEWMKSPRSKENDNVCLFLSSIQARLQRAYPNLKVEVNFNLGQGACLTFISLTLRADENHVSGYLSYIPHYLSANTPTELMEKTNPEQVVTAFITYMEKFR